MRIAIVNGPNLNLLGEREPEIYGTRGFDAYYEALVTRFPEVELDCFQSNGEGALIDHLHSVGFDRDGVVLNAGGYTHTSVALGDAVKAIPAPVVEVHISNTFARESFRHHSYLSAGAYGIIAGMGLIGYDLAIQALRAR